MRRGSLAALILAVVILFPAPAGAGDDLEDYLRDAAAADFHGTGLLVCSWGDDTAAGAYDVTRRDGMSMTHGPGGDLMVTPDMTAMRSGEEWYAIEFADRSEWNLSSRYSLGTPTPVTHFGRPASEYVVFEAGSPRVRMVVDDATRVPLVTEVLDGDGGVFRTAALIRFDEAPGPMPAAPVPMASLMVAEALPGETLPADLFGYRRADAYEVPGGAVQAFYTDGLFSFSVFETGRGARPDVFDDATEWEVDGETYRRVVTPSQVWVHWNAPDRSYVLVGDLPPDHIELVLSELPEPGDRGLLVRLWRRLFG